MSKRKRAAKDPADESQPPAQPVDESSDDATVKADMVHVTSDMLSGSPDIFAAKKTGEAPAEAASAEPPADASEPPAQKPESETTLASAPEPPPPPPPAPFIETTPVQPKRPGGNSTAALGIVLVVVGIFALAVVLSGYDLTQNGWPLFIIIPGLTLLIVGFVKFGAVATVPGGIVTMLGLVLAYANNTGDWPVWAYAWALVLPGGIGVGMYLQALRDHDQQDLRTGRTLMFISLMIFLIGFVLFESILGISGRDYFGNVGKAALPALLIIVGVILLVRSIQAGRRT